MEALFWTKKIFLIIYLRYILIIELSSYQLDKVKFLKLHYGLITNIYIDHLDYHKNVKNYIRSSLHSLLYKNSYLFLTKKLYLNYQDF